jgi:pyrrolidone-carboxylate peptidase
MVVIIAGFGDFLWHGRNSSEIILKKIPDQKDITKCILPVGYFKNDFIKPLKKNSVSKYVVLGMWEGTYPKLETKGKNQHITLKNPLLRTGASAYSHILKQFGKNLRIKEPLDDKQLITKTIDKKGPKFVLTTKIRKNPGIKISYDAGNYVCNYAIYTIARYLKKSKSETEFYFLHIPEKCTSLQEKAVLKTIQILINNKPTL